MPSEQAIDAVLDSLRGPRGEFRKAVTDTDEILANFMAFVEKLAKKRKQPTWSLVGQITGHGSGVASAIYELYRRKR
jgi:hypothetical protein